MADMTRDEFWGFNTQPPEGGWVNHQLPPIVIFEFQHAAARRRLVPTEQKGIFSNVSTRSRPKAAGR